MKILDTKRLEISSYTDFRKWGLPFRLGIANSSYEVWVIFSILCFSINFIW